MSDSVAELQLLLNRFEVDPGAARRQLLQKATTRLSALAARMMRESFPVLCNRHDVDSVVNESWIRLLKALDATEPQTVQDFLRLAAHKMRQILLEMVIEQRKIAAREFHVSGGLSGLGTENAESTWNPERLAAWTQFHEQVAALPDDERGVFEMHYYLEMTQAEVAHLTNRSPRMISRLWVAAVSTLRRQCGHLLDVL